MKRSLFSIFLLLLLLSFQNFAFAQDTDSDNLWENWKAQPEINNPNKNVSDEEFDKIINQLKEKKNKKEAKQKKKLIPKGEAFNEGNESETLTTKVDETTLPVVCIPIELEIGDGILPIGHYQLKAENENGVLVLKFYQAHYLMAQINAIETNDDFGEENLVFAKILFEDDNTAKIIYGSMDYNAYAIIDLK